MKRAWLLLLLWALSVPVPALAENADGPDAQSDIPLPIGPQPRRFEMAPQLSVLSISGLTLPTPGYSVAYVPTIEGLPTIQLVFGRPVADFGRFGLTMQASLGYGSRSGDFQATPDGGTAFSEALTLHWIPVVVSAKFTYNPVVFPYLRPSLTLGFGSLTLSQTSSTPGLARTVGVPMVVVSPALTFMDGGSRHWLRGFSFGATVLRGLGGDATVAATSLDLSINLLL